MLSDCVTNVSLVIAVALGGLRGRCRGEVPADRGGLPQAHSEQGLQHRSVQGHTGADLGEQVLTLQDLPLDRLQDPPENRSEHDSMNNCPEDHQHQQDHKGRNEGRSAIAFASSVMWHRHEPRDIGDQSEM